jgi:hypothetical protein
MITRVSLLIGGVTWWKIAREGSNLHFSVWDFGVMEERLHKILAQIAHIYVLVRRGVACGTVDPPMSWGPLFNKI